MESDIDILDDRLRGILTNPNLYYQMTFTFNPVSATHWIKRKYFDYKMMIYLLIIVLIYKIDS